MSKSLRTWTGPRCPLGWHGPEGHSCCDGDNFRCSCCTHLETWIFNEPLVSGNFGARLACRIHTHVGVGLRRCGACRLRCTSRCFIVVFRPWCVVSVWTSRNSFCCRAQNCGKSAVVVHHGRCHPIITQRQIPMCVGRATSWVVVWTIVAFPQL